MSYQSRLRAALDRLPPPTIDQLLRHGDRMVARESEPHTVSEGGTEEDAEYWRRRNALREFTEEE